MDQCAMREMRKLLRDCGHIKLTLKAHPLLLELVGQALYHQRRNFKRLINVWNVGRY